MKKYSLFLIILLLLIVPLISASWFSDLFKGSGKAVTAEDGSVAVDDSGAVAAQDNTTIQKSGLTRFFESIFGGASENKNGTTEPVGECPDGCICDSAFNLIKCETPVENETNGSFNFPYRIADPGQTNHYIDDEVSYYAQSYCNNDEKAISGIGGCNEGGSTGHEIRPSMVTYQWIQRSSNEARGWEIGCKGYGTATVEAICIPRFNNIPISNNSQPSTATWMCHCGGQAYTAVDDIRSWVATCNSANRGCYSSG